MKLSKIIPPHVRTLTARWCKKDFMVMDQKYRDIRARCASPMDTCHWCGHKFCDGEMMALASFCCGTGNKMLCQTCATELLASEPASP